MPLCGCPVRLSTKFWANAVGSLSQKALAQELISAHVPAGVNGRFVRSIFVLRTRGIGREEPDHSAPKLPLDRFLRPTLADVADGPAVCSIPPDGGPASQKCGAGIRRGRVLARWPEREYQLGSVQKVGIY